MTDLAVRSYTSPEMADLLADIIPRMEGSIGGPAKSDRHHSQTASAYHVHGQELAQIKASRADLPVGQDTFAIMSGPADQDALVSTSHSNFFRPPPSPSQPPIAILLRGVNLSSTSKFPNISRQAPAHHDLSLLNRAQRDEARRARAGVQSHLSEEEGGMYSGAEKGGREGWFVGHPFVEPEVDLCAPSISRDRRRSKRS